MNAAAFLCNFDGDVRQLENSARSEKRCAAEVEKKIGYLRRGRFGSRLERISHRIRHRHHENEVGQWKSGRPHRSTSEKEKTSRPKPAKERQGQKHEAIISGRRSARE